MAYKLTKGTISTIAQDQAGVDAAIEAGYKLEEDIRMPDFDESPRRGRKARDEAKAESDGE